MLPLNCSKFLFRDQILEKEIAISLIKRGLNTVLYAQRWAVGHHM